MVFNATFNNVSVIWGLSVLLVKETRVTEKTTNHKSLTNTVYCKTAIPNRKFNVRLISIRISSPHLFPRGDYKTTDRK
jgi:hypothetical protein